MDQSPMFGQFGFVNQNAFEFPIDSAKNPSSSLNQFIKNQNMNNIPNEIPKYYSDLKMWVNSLSNISKPEVFSLLYAFFYNSIVVMMLSQTKRSIIKSFINDYSTDFVKDFAEEISSLTKLVNTKSTAVNYRKFNVLMTKQSLLILISYLADNNQTLLLFLLNQYVNVKIISQEAQMLRLSNGEPVFVSNIDSNSSSDLIVNLLADNPIDLSKEFLDSVNSKYESFSILDSSKKRTFPIEKVPNVDMEQIMYTSLNIINMDRLSKNNLPTCGYFNFPKEHVYYDINDCGSLLSVCTGSAITKLYSLDVSVDLDNIVPISNPKNEKESSDFELINHFMVPRSSFTYKDHFSGQMKNSYFTRSLIGQKSMFCTFSHDSSLLLTGGAFETRIWSAINSNSIISVQTPSINWCGDWNPYGEYYLLGSSDGTASIYSFNSPKTVRSFVGHTKDVIDVKYHPNANIVASASLDGTIRLFDVSEGQQIRAYSLQTTPTCISFHPSGRYLVCGDEKGGINVWDLSNDKKLLEIKDSHKDTTVSDLCISKDGQVLASVGEDIAIWDFQAISSRLEVSEKPMKRTAAKESRPRRIKFTDTNLLLCIGETLSL
ncbi:hypothetical protein TVAG_265450 [Trichomonas vaginalis G3]|uniref:TFIID subunit TAF5 NTD2 domain-containing protein n=1 Tax=Trichomonas vaginalis (strain ATCC PRA-98 / G3) TaxID=412133 RepID=A2FGB0_TRIV3|nr:transcription initiation from RNA polymerase II promoter [Trichomonas vaginalis G3]EAX96056.1 hypothetical protein TVAG_265450 [Trichomonas vaginalis G3]KAI5504000.1 transcription initiation from RNA polymerase II promoter [Trichomonas vaginalis G3]|eukprot:XP_001308986.1 hypothetical protein [Trichomonas vaginalis G3]